MTSKNDMTDVTPDTGGCYLRDRLLELASGRDWRILIGLCRENKEAIAEDFEDWLNPPEGLAGNEKASNEYFNGLYGISKMLDDAVGGTRLFPQLVAAGRRNPFALWERKIESGQALIRKDRPREAFTVLADHLIDSRHLEGFGYAHMRATTHWYISQCCIFQKDRDGAVDHAVKSLRITEEIEDHPRYLARYLEFLYRTHFRFGEHERAAAYADRLASLYELLDYEEGGREFRRRAEEARGIDQLGAGPVA